MTAPNSTPKLRKTLLWLIPLGLLLAVILVVYYKNAFTNLILARGDAYLYFYPYWQSTAQALQVGRLPLWNPDLFMGAPHLANSQTGVFYPLNWPVWWLFETPYAVSASIILHVFIAGCGTYWAARRTINASRWAAFVAAVLFALGGYVTAQVEHVNQLQGLAWLPWLFGVACCWDSVIGSWWGIGRKLLAIATLFALQLLAGHTQTTFISGIGLLLWVTPQLLQLVQKRKKDGKAVLRYAVTVALVLGGGVLLALLIAAVQLLPTLELTQLSLRSDGLSTNEALSFSLHPLLAARALLPGYGQTSYVEYVAYLPLTGLVLAVFGAWQWRKQPVIAPALLLAVVGPFLALGLANPVYRFGLVHLPGFGLFRVPARWMVLFAFGAALLAAVGWDWLAAREWRLTGRERRLLLIALLVALVVVGVALISVPLARFVPMPPESPAQWPNEWSLVGWVVELVVVVVILWRPFGRIPTKLVPYLLIALIFISLFAASRVLSAYDMTTLEAFFDVRPTIARLQADAVEARASGLPPDRYLSMSGGFFDPGDQAEIDTIYADQLSEEAQLRYTITLKDKEIIVPNLSLVYGLSAVDGFDGGVLPLADYVAVADLLLPDGADTVDGRLRESITSVPEARWLDLFNVRYLITDKVGDQWFRSDEMEVFFDLQHSVTLQPGDSAEIGYLPPYEATELWLVADGAVGNVIANDSHSEAVVTPERIGDSLYRVRWDEAMTPTAIRLTQSADASQSWTINGLALVDSRDKTFQQLVPGNYQRIHSGDVKIYENLDVLPRAFMVGQAVSAESTAAAVEQMRDSTFDPRQTVLLNAHEPLVFPDVASMKATITHYEPERIVISAESDSGGILVLTDANYPGWQATIDGESAEIVTANGLFRAVVLPAGAHEVVFSLQQNTIGLIVSIVGFALLLIGVLLTVFWRRSAKTNAQPDAKTQV